jgi:hypothetical protein
MKSIFFTLLTFVFLPFMLSAQNIQESPRTMSLGTKNSYYFNVDNLNAKEVEKQWNDFIKEANGKTKKDRKTNEVFADNVSLPTISSNLVDVYATFTDKGNNNTEVVVWADLGGAFLSAQDHPEKVEPFRSWLNTFGRKTRVRKVEIEQETEEAKLKDLNKDYTRLQKDQDRLNKDIADYQQKLADAQKNLEINKAAQATRQQEVMNQQKVLDLVKEKLKRVE